VPGCVLDGTDATEGALQLSTSSSSRAASSALRLRASSSVASSDANCLGWKRVKCFFHAALSLLGAKVMRLHLPLSVSRQMCSPVVALCSRCSSSRLRGDGFPAV